MWVMSNDNKFTFLEASNYNEQRSNHLLVYVPIYFSYLSEHIQMCSNFSHNQLHYNINLAHEWQMIVNLELQVQITPTMKLQ